MLQSRKAKKKRSEIYDLSEYTVGDAAHGVPRPKTNADPERHVGDAAHGVPPARNERRPGTTLKKRRKAQKSKFFLTQSGSERYNISAEARVPSGCNPADRSP